MTELFIIRGRKLNIFLAFITQSYFSVPKDIKLNSTHCFIIKIRNKRQLQKITFNHSLDIDYESLQKMHQILLHQIINIIFIIW